MLSWLPWFCGPSHIIVLRILGPFAPNWKAFGFGITSPNAWTNHLQSHRQACELGGELHHKISHLVTWEQMKRSLTATTSSFSHTPILRISATWWYLHTTYWRMITIMTRGNCSLAKVLIGRIYLNVGVELRTVSCDRRGRIFNCFLINSCKGRTVYYFRTDETRRLIRHWRISDSAIEYRIYIIYGIYRIHRIYRI